MHIYIPNAKYAKYSKYVNNTIQWTQLSKVHFLQFGIFCIVKVPDQLRRPLLHFSRP